jgi:hypothetical protein
MRDLAKAFRPEDLSQNAFQLYEKFRPAIPQGVTDWCVKGRLDIDRIRSLAWIIHDFCGEKRKDALKG